MLENQEYLSVSPEALPEFFPLFQKGIRVQVETGCTLRELLCNQWHIPEDYVEGRISTIFLNSKPVDDLDTSIIDDGAILALSSAMPGLVGAVMRRGGFYSSLRDGITWHGDGKNVSRKAGLIRVKLFNLLMEELGPGFLARGFLAERSDLIPHFPDRLRPEGPTPVRVIAGAL